MVQNSASVSFSRDVIGMIKDECSETKTIFVIFGTFFIFWNFNCFDTKLDIIDTVLSKMRVWYMIFKGLEQAFLSLRRDYLP